MDLEARKITFVQEFLRLQNEEIVSELEKLLRKRKAELTENKFKPMTMVQYDVEIDQAMEDSKNGRMIKVSDLKTKIPSWCEHSILR
jgi:GTP cyclohydrolase I